MYITLCFAGSLWSLFCPLFVTFFLNSKNARVLSLIINVHLRKKDSNVRENVSVFIDAKNVDVLFHSESINKDLYSCDVVRKMRSCLCRSVAVNFIFMSFAAKERKTTTSNYNFLLSFCWRITFEELHYTIAAIQMKNIKLDSKMEKLMISTQVKNKFGKKNVFRN